MNGALSTRRAVIGFACAALLALAVAPARADDAQKSYRLAIKGYDPVAYFTEGKAVAGRPEFELVWNESRWRFASAAHRDRFRADADRYAPQYAGYCALGIAKGEKYEVDPKMWTIVDGKLYLNFDREIREDWRKHKIANIRKADSRWQAIRN